MNPSYYGVNQATQQADNNLLFLIALIMLILGFAIAWFIYAAPLQDARRKVDRLKMEVQGLQQIHAERLKTYENARSQMQNTFTALSQHALRDNNAQFLQLAQETLMRFQSNAQYDLEDRQQAIDEMLEPVYNALEQTRRQITDIERDRQKTMGSVAEQLRAVAEENDELRQETSKLVTALRRPEVRGQWGEITLKRIVELAGMVEYCDFIEQAHQASGDRVVRPDLIVTMPDNRELIIDAKTPLDAYLTATSTEDKQVRKREYLRHAKIVRNHMKALAAKRYWEQFENAPDFVILFMPGEQFLGAALEYDKQLLKDALAEKVILASPTSLIALLRSVAFGWKQVALSENSEVIRDLGEELYKRVATFTEHMARLGKSLNTSVDNYNKALGSLERTVLPGARKFTELGIQENKPIPDAEIIEATPRLPVEGDYDENRCH